jgi:hypothetical protein
MSTRAPATPADAVNFGKSLPGHETTIQLDVPPSTGREDIGGICPALTREAP